MTLRARYLSFARTLNRLTANACMLLLAVLCIAQILIVILRYAFGMGFLELQDVVTYAFAMLVVLGVPVALAGDGHVRVDIFRNGQSARTRRRIDLSGVALFLIPVFGMTLWLVMPQVLYSWAIREGGVETGGLPGFFIVKTALPVACALMLVQGVAVVLRRGGGAGEDENGI